MNKNKATLKERRVATLRTDLHGIAKLKSREKGMTLEAFNDDVFETGLRVKKLMPTTAAEVVNQP